MKWIGLTGGIATGKSTVAKILRDLGYPVIDADALAREASSRGSEGLAEIVQKFGGDVLTKSGELDRKKLGSKVFGSSEMLLQLEAILHPKVQTLKAKAKVTAEAQGADLAFYDVPLLFEKNLEAEFDSIVLVYAAETEQRERLKSRDNLSGDEIQQRLSVQIPIDDKVKRADFVIINRGNIAELKAAVMSVLRSLKNCPT